MKEQVMKLKSILCPTDFSISSNAALLGYASALAAETGATLFIVHVAEDSQAYLAGYGSFAFADDVSDSLEREMRKQLEDTEPKRDGVRVQRHYLVGTAVPQIVEFADREDVDLIVMGTHGRTGLSRMLMGSIAEGVLRKASCPVLTVKSPMKRDESMKASKESSQRPIRPSMSKFSQH